jgi:Putative homoserine kinase type II (protein kinase fold)
VPTGFQKTEEIINELAQAAKYHYDLSESTEVRLLNRSENTTYLVEDVEKGVRTVLRINRPGYHSPGELIGELLWMDEIRKHTQLVVPEPIAGLNGEYVQTLQHTELPHAYNCIMFSFIDGQAPDESDERTLLKQFYTLGEITALLHENVRGWGNSRSISRFSWNYDSMLGEHPRWGKWQKAAGIIPELKVLYERASRVIKRRLELFGETGGRFGLIHADLRLANLLVNGDEIAVIDFDDCGFGWFLYDFGAAVSFIEHKPFIPDLMGAWLEGYRKIRALSGEEEKEIPTFVMLRRLMLMGWLASHSESDKPKELGDDFLEDYSQKTAALAEAYLSRYA